MGISQTSPLHLSDTGFVTQTLGTVGSPSASMESPEGRDLQGNDMYQDSSGSDVEMIAMETEPFYDQALDSSHENSSISSQGEESFGVQGVPPIHLALLDALGGAPFGPDEFSGSSTGDSHAEHDDEGWEAEGEGSSDENEEEDQDVPSTGKSHTRSASSDDTHLDGRTERLIIITMCTSFLLLRVPHSTLFGDRYTVDSRSLLYACVRCLWCTPATVIYPFGHVDPFVRPV